jgi:hypothetical protein
VVRTLHGGRSDHALQRINVDFPIWMIHSLDKEEKRLGVSRQSIIVPGDRCAHGRREE